MFKKPHDAAVSATTLVRNKELKAVISAAAAQFPALAAGAGAERLFPSGAAESQKLGNRLVAYADAGDHCPVLIELDPKAGIGKGRLMPTVFALWRVPDLLPTLRVPHPVSRFIINGADLMWPGVLAPIPVRLTKGALVAVRVVGNPCPLAVGALLCSLSDAADAGYRGRALEVLHVYRDALWEAAGRRVPNEGFLQAEVRPSAAGHEELESLRLAGGSSGAAGGEGGGSSEEDGDEEVADAGVVGGITAESVVDCAETGGSSGSASELVGCAAGSGGTSDSLAPPGTSTVVPYGVSTAPSGPTPLASNVESRVLIDGDEVAAAAPGFAISTPAAPSAEAPALPFWASWGADDLLLGVLLQALRRHARDRDLPITAARLHGAIMQGCRPAGSPALDPRATRWRKVGVLLHDLEGRGLISLTTACGAGGGGGAAEETLAVSAVDRSHPLLVAHRTWPASAEHSAAGAAPADEESGGSAAAAAAAAAAGVSITCDGLVAPAASAVAGYRPPLFLQLCMPPPAAFPVFRHVLRPAAGGGCDASTTAPLWSPTTGFRLGAVKSARPAVVARLARVALLVSVSKGKGPRGGDAAAVAAAVSGSGGTAEAASALHELHRGLDVADRLFTAAETVEALRAYIADRRLAHPTDPTRIILDLVVADALTGPARVDPKHDLAELAAAAAAVSASAGVAAGAAGAAPVGALGEGASEAAEEEEEEEGGGDDESSEDGAAAAAAGDDDDASMSRVDVARLWAKRMTKLNAIIFPAAAAAAAAGIGAPGTSSATASAAATVAYLTGDVVLLRGAAPPSVSVMVKALQGGRKHITYVAGLAAYRIDEAAFARECSKRCAASASLTTAAEAGVIPAVAAAGAGGGDAVAARCVVQVQGDEAEAVAALLTDAKGYGLPRSVVLTPADAAPAAVGPRSGAGGKKKSSRGPAPGKGKAPASAAAAAAGKPSGGAGGSAKAAAAPGGGKGKAPSTSGKR